MHSDMELGGPGITIAAVVLVLWALASLFVLIDSLRRPRAHFGRLGRVPYVIFSALFIVSMVAALVMRYGGVATGLAGALLGTIAVSGLLTTISTIVYLLEVVFPPKETLEARTATTSNEPEEESR